MTVNVTDSTFNWNISSWQFGCCVGEMNGPPTAGGAYVSLATSSDTRFPPESVIDG